MSETIFTPQGKTLLIERVFKAPLERLWNAWTVPEKLARWWGPRGWETTIKTFEFKDGGVWEYCMECVDKNQGSFYGQVSCGLATFQTINPTHGFTYIDQFTDTEGVVNDDLPSIIISLTFEALPDGSTKLSSHGEFASEADLKTVMDMGMEQGLRETWDRLEELVSEAGGQ